MTGWLLKAANLDSTHERLIKATITDLVYEVRDKLIKVFAEESIERDVENSMSTLKIKSEPSYYTNNECFGDDQHTDSDEEEVYYIKRQPTQRFSKYVKQKPNSWRQKRTCRAK